MNSTLGCPAKRAHLNGAAVDGGLEGCQVSGQLVAWCALQLKVKRGARDARDGGDTVHASQACSGKPVGSGTLNPSVHS